MNLRMIGEEDGDSSGNCVCLLHRKPSGSGWAENPADELARRGDWDNARGKRPSETEIDLY